MSFPECSWQDSILGASKHSKSSVSHQKRQPTPNLNELTSKGVKLLPHPFNSCNSPGTSPRVSPGYLPFPKTAKTTKSMCRATVRNEMCVWVIAAIALRSPYLQGHGIIHRCLTACGLDLTAGQSTGSDHWTQREAMPALLLQGPGKAHQPRHQPRGGLPTCRLDRSPSLLCPWFLSPVSA